MPTNISLPLLDRIHVANPCPARWEDMFGNDSTRHCAQCDLDVHNLSELTRDQAEAVLARLSEGRVCARFFRRSDGTILTRDCPVGLRAARARLLGSIGRIAAAVGLAGLSIAAAKASQDKTWGNWGWSMRLRNVTPVNWALSKWSNRFTQINGNWISGDISPPDQNPPPVQDGPFGPHTWEYRQ